MIKPLQNHFSEKTDNYTFSYYNVSYSLSDVMTDDKGHA